MDILRLYERLKDSYKDYLESFVAIKDRRIEERVHEAISKETLWPDALIQFNPNYEKGKTISEMIDEGLPIDPDLSLKIGFIDISRKQLNLDVRIKSSLLHLVLVLVNPGLLWPLFLTISSGIPILAPTRQ